MGRAVEACFRFLAEQPDPGLPVESDPDATVRQVVCVSIEDASREGRHPMDDGHRREVMPWHFDSIS